MTNQLKRRLVEKAVKRKRSGITFQVVIAAAFSKRGNLLGTAMNNPSEVPGWRHKHAEGILMAKHGKAIKRIVILRVGNKGDLLPIEPCEQCRKLAERLQIEIKTL